MRHRALGVFALPIVVAASLVAVAAPATAATVSVASPGGFVADGVHQRVFVGDRSTGTVLAADYDGNLIDSASGISGVSDLALSADSQVLYAASWGTHEIVALDPATLDEITRYTASTTYGPRHLAFAGGKVWFSYGDQWSGNVGSIAPSTGEVTMNQYPNHVWGQALLDGSTAKPDLLAVGETGLTSDSMAVLDVSGAPSQVAFHNGNYTLNHGIGDIDLIPGAAEVLVNGQDRQGYAEGTFSASGTYPSGSRADISSTGIVATAADDKVKIFRPDGSLPVNTFAVSALALTWAPDESRLFALTGSGPFALNVIDAPTFATPSLTVSAPSSAPRAQPLTVSGTLTSGDPFASSVSLDVLRKDSESPDGAALPSVAVGPDGTWSLEDTPTVGGPVTYVVSYPGDADHNPVTSSVAVSVSRTTPTLTLRPTTAATYTYGKKVAFTAHLGSTYQNRRIELWVDPSGEDKPNTLVRSGAVNAKGDISWTATMRRNSVVSAVYAGDAQTAPRTVSVTANARVAIKVAMTRQYKTAKIGSQKYYWFHKRTAPIVKTTMSSYPGRAARLNLQVRVNGSWRSAGYGYFDLSSGGHVSVNIGAPNRAGSRGGFDPPTSGRAPVTRPTSRRMAPGHTCTGPSRRRLAEPMSPTGTFVGPMSFRCSSSTGWAVVQLAPCEASDDRGHGVCGVRADDHVAGAGP